MSNIIKFFDKLAVSRDIEHDPVLNYEQKVRRCQIADLLEAEEGITITMVVLFFVMLFFWYSQVTGAAFNAGVSFITITMRNL